MYLFIPSPLPPLPPLQPPFGKKNNKVYPEITSNLYDDHTNDIDNNPVPPPSISDRATVIEINSNLPFKKEFDAPCPAQIDIAEGNVSTEEYEKNEEKHTESPSNINTNLHNEYVETAEENISENMTDQDKDVPNQNTNDNVQNEENKDQSDKAEGPVDDHNQSKSETENSVLIDNQVENINSAVSPVDDPKSLSVDTINEPDMNTDKNISNHCGSQQDTYFDPETEKHKADVCSSSIIRMKEDVSPVEDVQEHENDEQKQRLYT